MVIEDLFALGLVFGALENLPVNLIDYLLHRVGINKVFIWHVSTSTFVEKKDIKTKVGLFIGAVNDYAMASFKGFVTVYVLYFTGVEHYIIKGVGVALFFWMLFFGAILRLSIARVDTYSLADNHSRSALVQRFFC